MRWGEEAETTQILNKTQICHLVLLFRERETALLWAFVLHYLHHDGAQEVFQELLYDSNLCIHLDLGKSGLLELFKGTIFTLGNFFRKVLLGCISHTHHLGIRHLLVNRHHCLQDKGVEYALLRLKKEAVSLLVVHV